MLDLSNLHNPYDFANPVFDPDLFIGREDELREIRYYLDHAKTAPRPINIALLGQRASGKTSMLNMAEIEAKNRGFCTVRIDLDEYDAKTLLGFFYKIFDGIFSAVCDLGAFEGKEGGTYDTYLDIVNTYNIPEDKTFCPFLFPFQYAKAMGSGNVNAQLSDYNYKCDLVKISSEIKVPIILLCDECNVLANSRVHLEKLRNIFMNTPGFMLVLTGTPDLFPLIDEVFSPIVRQFKKIPINPFKDEEDTKECIRRPLENVSIDPDEIFDFESYRDIIEIHDITRGRPYEIQLICHMLFRRVQDKRAKRMKLDLSVLEDVRKELETSQDITTRPILTKIRNLRKKQLSALSLLCACDGQATFDQIWALEYIFNGEKFCTKDNLNRELQYFINEDIIKDKNGLIKFAGDEFDKIYTKYFAREQKVSFNFPELSLEFYWFIRLLAFIIIIEGLTLMKLEQHDINVDIDSIVVKMASKIIDEDVFVESPSIIKNLYKLMLHYRNKETISIVSIKITLPWLNVHSWLYAQNPNNTEPIDSFLYKIKPLKERAIKIGGSLEAEKNEFPVVPIDTLTNKIVNTANERLRDELAGYHAIRMSREYLKEKANVEEALFHANLSYKYNPNPESVNSNNLGYLFMAVGDLDKARILLKKAINSYKEPYEIALPIYNLGILEVKCAKFKNALTTINQCIKKIENVEKIKRKCACLFVPRVIDDELKIEEIRKPEPDLLEVAQEAKDNIEFLLNSKSK